MELDTRRALAPGPSANPERTQRPLWVTEVIDASVFVLPLLAVCAAIPLAFSYGSYWPLALIPLSLVAVGGIVAANGYASVRLTRRWAYAIVAGCTTLTFLLFWTGEANWYHRETETLSLLLLGVTMLLYLGLSVGIFLGIGLAIGAAVANWKEQRVRALYVLTIYIVLGAVPYALIWFNVRLPSVHSDDAMIAHFQAHQRELELLVQMLDHDPSLHMNKMTCPSPVTTTPAGAMDGRQGELRRLLREANIGAISRCATLKGARTVELSFWADAMYNTEKGYVYSLELLTPTVESIDDDPGHYAFRSIAPNWYLYRKPTT
jgi:hypothetical protein